MGPRGPPGVAWGARGVQRVSLSLVLLQGFNQEDLEGDKKEAKEQQEQQQEESDSDDGVDRSGQE